MAKRMYRVRVVLYVMAETEAEARLAATQARFDIFECSARKADQLDPEWENAIPYNADDERTCAEIFNGPARPAALPARSLRTRREPRLAAPAAAYPS